MQLPSSPRPTMTHKDSDGSDDVVLVDRCRRGDERAWAQLVKKYRSLVYSAALRTGLDEEGANEVFQLVWTEVFQSLHRIRDAQALPRWLVVTSRRIAYKQALAGSKMVEGVFDDMVDPDRLPDDELESLQQRLAIEGFLDRLRKPCPQLLRLLFLNTSEPSYDEVSDALAIPIGSIGPTRSRCLNQLRRVMEEES